ncbi:MAG: GumC family protein, partial [Gemmatimonadota bacterium]
PGLPAIGPMLRRRRWTIVSALAIVVVGAAILTHFWNKTYTSTATVLVQAQAAEGGDIPGVAVLERVGQGNALETEIELLKSRRVVEPVVEAGTRHLTVRVGGTERPAAELFSRLDSLRAATPGIYQVTAAPGATVRVAGMTLTRSAAGPAGAIETGEIEIHVRPFAEAVTATRDHLTVEQVSREGDLLRLDCTGDSAAAAQALCQAVLDQYVALHTELQRSEASVAAAFLRDQVARLGDSLAVAEDSLEAYVKRTQSVALGEQASEEVRTYAMTKAQRDQIEAERRALSGIINRTEGARAGGDRRYRDLASFPTLMQNQAVTGLIASIAELETRRSELAQRRTEQNPELRALDARIAALDRQLRGIASSYERSLRAQVGALDRTLGGSSGRLASFPGRQVESARREREVVSLGELHRLLTTRLREAEVAEAVTRPTVQIMDTASLPIAPSSPSGRMNLILALVLGLGFGLAVALYREHADTRIHGRAALERRTDLPVLSMIPWVRGGGPVLPATALEAGDQAAEALAAPAVLDEHGTSLISTSRPARARRDRRPRLSSVSQNVALEAFRSLGADLQFVARQLENGDLRSVAITSAGRGEGKTFTACNLAITRASFGVQTLLIDGDMRAGGVGRFFDLPSSSPGLSELLSGGTTARDARRTLRIGETDTLSVMPSGAPTSNAAELLETSYFEAMLAGAQAVYDLVIIDTPPLNVLTDAAAIVSCVDAVLVVVRKGVTDGEALELTLERLRRAGGPVVGVVLNDMALPRQYAYGAYQYA